MNVFLNNRKQIKCLWWVVIFFLVLAAFTFPLIIISKLYGWEITITQQAVVVIIVTWISQTMRKKPMSELWGKPGPGVIKNAVTGILAGALLMLLPAMLLTLFGFIRWQHGNGDGAAILHVTGLSLSVAVTEEFLFRGFIFQRLRQSTGLWTAQLLIAAYFLLTHLNNPGMAGSISILASLNIFIASVMFGLAYVRSNSLVMPIGFHFMSNWTQGPLLGFGVSGNQQASLFKPVFFNVPDWVTGGTFGLEASVTGLVFVIISTFILYRRGSDPATHVHNHNFQELRYSKEIH